MLGRRRGRDDRTPESAPGPTDTNGEPLSNDALVDAMRSVADTDDEVTRSLLFRLLLDATMVVVAPEVTATRTWTAQQGEKLGLVTLREGDDDVLPIFTSVSTLLVWRPAGGGFAALPARALFQMAASAETARILIDPGSSPQGVLVRSEIVALSRGRLPLGSGEVVTESTEVRIGRPATGPPPDLVAHVTDAMTACGTVDRAWIYLMQQGASSPELVVAVGFRASVDVDSVSGAMRAIVDGAGRRDDRVKQLAFTPLTDALETSLKGGAGNQIFPV